MNRKLLWGKLELKLMLCLIFSFTVSVGIFFLLLGTGEGILDNYFNKTSYIENQKEQAISRFRSYVTVNGLTIKDQDKFSNWVQKEKYVTIFIYKDNDLVYTSENNNYTVGNVEHPDGPMVPTKLLYDIEFADTNAKLYMECFFQYKYYYIVTFLDVAISFLCFIIIMLLFINKKTFYIRILENEIKILEGGNLNYQITVKGKDELSSLAQSINEMRKSFIERLENEDNARQANSELVTAMSHDLRTPLTALMGYLDIIEFKKYKTQENLVQYIHNSREKAYQIKYLSDKLFEYFTVYNINEDTIELESFDGNQLIDQLIDEQLLLLQYNGFHFEFNPCSKAFDIEVNLISIRRVFDNIFSNITKYADKVVPVKIECYIENQLLFINIENSISKNLKMINSTGIGMKTCEKIIEKHNGKISVTKKENTYSVHISLQVLNCT